MNQEVFWIVSTINFAVVAIMTIINMTMSIITATKMRNLNKKIGVDLSMHKELMNSISNFISSIEYNKINYPRNMENNEDFPLIIIKNYSDMKDKYIKLILYIQYSYVDFTDFKKSLDDIYNKYCKAFELLSLGISNKQFCAGLDKNSKGYSNIYNKSLAELAQYREIVDDKRVDEDFFEKLNLFIKEEADYIKGR